MCLPYGCAQKALSSAVIVFRNRHCEGGGEAAWDAEVAVRPKIDGRSRESRPRARDDPVGLILHTMGGFVESEQQRAEWKARARGRSVGQLA